MEAALARAILEEAIRGGFREQPLSEGDKLIEDGEYYLKEAHKAHAAGMKEPEIEAIMRLGGWEPGGDDLSSSVKDEPSEPREVEPSSQEQVVQKAETRPVEKAQDQPYGNLPVPDDPEGDPTPMPRDLSSTDDRELRRLSGEQNAFLARVTWLLSLAQQDLRNATHLRESEYRKKVLEFKHRADEAGEKMTMSQSEKEAGASSEVMEWDSRIVDHANVVDSYKALREIYKGNLERLSREASMRQDEWLRAGGKR